MLALLEKGYAIAESGSRGGVAVNEAVKDTDALRRHFGRKHSRPKAIFAVGESMGGLVALRLVERFPSNYTAGLSYCGMLSSPSDYVRRVFDLLALFAFFHPGVLPNPDQVPTGFRPTEELMKNVARALETNPKAAEILFRESGANGIEDLAPALVFHTDLLRDVGQRCGGNVIDNRGTLYVSGEGTERVNKGLRRVSAAPNTTACLGDMSRPMGLLSRPFLAVDSTYDPIVPAWFANSYRQSIAGTAAEAWFVRQYASASGHCSVPLQTRLAAFQDLVKWSSEDGARPAPGLRDE